MNRRPSTSGRPAHFPTLRRLARRAASSWLPPLRRGGGGGSDAHPPRRSRGNPAESPLSKGGRIFPDRVAYAPDAALARTAGVRTARTTVASALVLLSF